MSVIFAFRMGDGGVARIRAVWKNVKNRSDKLINYMDVGVRVQKVQLEATMSTLHIFRPGLPFNLGYHTRLSSLDRYRRGNGW